MLSVCVWRGLVLKIYSRLCVKPLLCACACADVCCACLCNDSEVLFIIDVAFLMEGRTHSLCVCVFVRGVLFTIINLRRNPMTVYITCRNSDRGFILDMLPIKEARKKRF